MSVSGVSEGVLSPGRHPVQGRSRPDGAQLAAHCKWLLSQNVGLAVFGTNSEANSLSARASAWRCSTRLIEARRRRRRA